MSPTEFIDANAVYGFGAAQTMVQVLKQCGNDLSRDNIMKQAANLKDLELPMLLPGMKINTSPTNFAPIRQMQLATFNGAELGAVRRIADRLSDWRLRASGARPSLGVSPEPGDHRVEHRVGRDDGEAATERGRRQEAIERVTMRPFHRSRHETILSFEGGGDASLARKKRW